MRLEVIQLVRLGPLPSEGVDANSDLIRQYEQLILGVIRPVSDEEAIELIRLLGLDTCFGLAWSVVHLIESAPGWPIEACFEGPSGPWIQLLKARANKDLGKKSATYS